MLVKILKKKEKFFRHWGLNSWRHCLEKIWKFAAFIARRLVEKNQKFKIKVIQVAEKNCGSPK